MSDKPVWLVERGQSENQAPTVWWTGDESIGWGGWSPDANLAERFETKEAADAVIHLHSRPVVRDPSEAWGHATEHVWLP